MTGSYGLSRMLMLSTILHIIFLSLLSVPFKKPSKRIDFPSFYTVKLVPGVSIEKEEGLKMQTGSKETQAISKGKAIRQKNGRGATLKKEEKKEKSLLAKQSSPPSATSEEISHLESKIRELRRKALDVQSYPPGRSFGVSGPPSSGPKLEGELEAYVTEVWKKVRTAWGLPGSLSLKRDLETVVSVRIRRDGRIIAIEWEKKSGNRLYDESVLRTLRSVDPFPPFPQGIPYESIEIGFRFLPGELL